MTATMDIDGGTTGFESLQSLPTAPSMTVTMDIDGGTTGFESLPRDVQLRVVERLPAKDAVAFAGVNSACLSVYREVAGLGQFLKAIPRVILLENVLPRLDDEVDRVMFSRVNKSCRLAIQEAGLTPRHCTMPLTSRLRTIENAKGALRDGVIGWKVSKDWEDSTMRADLERFDLHHEGHVVLSALQSTRYSIEFSRETIRRFIGRDWCALAAREGNLDVVKWLVSEGAELSWQVCVNAAMRGHLHVLKWATETLDATGDDWWTSQYISDRGFDGEDLYELGYVPVLFKVTSFGQDWGMPSVLNFSNMVTGQRTRQIVLPGTRPYFLKRHATECADREKKRDPKLTAAARLETLRWITEKYFAPWSDVPYEERPDYVGAPDFECFHFAVQNDDVEMLRYLRVLNDAGTQPHEVDLHGLNDDYFGPESEFLPDMLKDAAQRGSLAVIKGCFEHRGGLTLQQRDRWSDELRGVCSAAAGYGQLEILKYLFTVAGFPLQAGLMHNFLRRQRRLFKYGKHSNFDCLRYAAEKNPRIRIIDEEDDFEGEAGSDKPPAMYKLSLAELAAARGNLDDLQWLHSKGVKFKQALYTAVTRGHLECARWLTTRGAAVYDLVAPFYEVVKRGDLDMLRHMIDNHWDSVVKDERTGPRRRYDTWGEINFTSLAAHNGHLDVMLFLLEQGAVLQEDAVYFAIRALIEGGVSVHMRPYIEQVHRVNPHDHVYTPLDEVRQTYGTTSVQYGLVVAKYHRLLSWFWKHHNEWMIQSNAWTRVWERTHYVVDIPTEEEDGVFVFEKGEGSCTYPCPDYQGLINVRNWCVREGITMADIGLDDDGSVGSSSNSRNLRQSLKRHPLEGFERKTASVDSRFQMGLIQKQIEDGWSKFHLATGDTLWRTRGATPVTEADGYDTDTEYE
mgnify:FL=1